MFRNNLTSFADFFLIGFQDLHSFRFLLFGVFLAIYILMLCGNVLIIILVWYSPHLHSPMYLFLCHLSISDLVYCSVIVPNMLGVIWKEGDSISFTACLTQFQIYGETISVSCMILAVMSYDRYVAICKPLHYSTIMVVQLQYQLVIASWLLGLLTAIYVTYKISQLKFCDNNVIDYYFCDIAPLLDLSCTDFTMLEIEVNIVAGVFVVLPFIFIAVTYLYIILTILKLSSRRQKAFYTCSSHLAVVCVYYGSIITIYLSSSKSHSFNVRKILSLLNTVGSPLLNPIIYSLRNAEIKAALWRLAREILGSKVMGFMIRTSKK